MKFNATSWKTTVSGVATAFFGFVAFTPALFAHWPWITDLAKFAMLGGLASIGLTAKDSNVTGGTALASSAVPDATLHAEAASVAETGPVALTAATSTIPTISIKGAATPPKP